MAYAVNVGVNDAKNTLTYDRTSSELKDLRDRNFSFIIEETTGGESHAIFRIKEGSTVLRENVSRPFPTGAIRKKSAKLQKDNFVVEVKKQAGFKLDDYF